MTFFNKSTSNHSGSSSTSSRPKELPPPSNADYFCLREGYTRNHLQLVSYTSRVKGKGGSAVFKLSLPDLSEDAAYRYALALAYKYNGKGWRWAGSGDASPPEWDHSLTCKVIDHATDDKSMSKKHSSTSRTTQGFTIEMDVKGGKRNLTVILVGWENEGKMWSERASNTWNLCISDPIVQDPGPYENRPPSRDSQAPLLAQEDQGLR